MLYIAISDQFSFNKGNLFNQSNIFFNRKEILDRNNILLATNLLTASLYANPQKMIDKEEASIELAKVIPGMTKLQIKKILDSNNNFVWIKHDLTPKEQLTIHNLGIAGLYFEKKYKRVYTYSNLTSHILGFVGRDNNGQGGIELFCDKNLKDIDSKSSNGNELQLSIDVKAQNIVSEELDAIINKFSAKGGVGIIADAESGEILAMVNKPDFDPHNIGSATNEQIFNKATLGVYEMGSVFKPITIAIGFDSAKLQINDLYNLGNPMLIGKWPINDYHPLNGWRSVPEIFMHSSNRGTVQIALEVGKETFKKYLKILGLRDKIDIELPEKAMPLYPSDRNWGDIHTATIAYGHGLAISPMHIIQAMIPVVNGGYMPKLTLLKKQNNNESKRVLNEKTSIVMNKLFRLCVTSGTGRKAEVKGYIPGGKTGTANKPAAGRYSKNSRLSSFIGAFPMTNPKYVIYVMIDEPKGTKETFGFATAGYTAAVAVGNIISRIGSLYGISAIDENNAQIQEILHIDYKQDDIT